MKEESDTDAHAGAPGEGEFGDVETAGETTAADTISGPADERPVGTDTMVEVDDSSRRKDDE